MSRWPRLFHAALLSAGLVGCAGGEPGGDLVVLSPWSPAEADARSGQPLQQAENVRWVRLPAERFRDWLASGRPADVLLGGPVHLYEALDSRGFLLDEPGGAGWKVAAVEPVGLRGDAPSGTLPASWPDLARDDTPWELTLGDPRSDPAVLAWAESRLNESGWPKAYGELVRVAARADLAGVAWPPLRPGRLTLAVGVLSPAAENPLTRVVHGGAVPRSSQNRELAARWLASRVGPRPQAVGAGLETALLVDLLGATLVEAQPELRQARAALLASGRPPAWEARLLEPPPWPPAEVLRLRASPAGRDDLDTLASALVPDRRARDWLVASWERPRRPTDGALISELASAAGGGLAREPRFRSWLRAEWAAWARQWYRWIARRARGGTPAPEAPESPR